MAVFGGCVFTSEIVFLLCVGLMVVTVFVLFGIVLFGNVSVIPIYFFKMHTEYLLEPLCDDT